MKKATRFLLLLLIFSLCFTLFSCGNTDNQAESDSNSSSDSTESENAHTFELTSDYVIVRSENDNSATAAAVAFRNAVKKATGIDLRLTTDYVPRGQEIKPEPYEILIGKTNRPVASSITNTLKGKDWCYQVVSENVIVIAGGNADANEAAVKQFLKDLFGYEESTQTMKGTSLTVGTSFNYEYPHPIKNLTINGNPLSSYTILAGNNNTEIATELADQLFTMTGFEIQVTALSSHVQTERTLTIDTLARVGSYEYTIEADSLGNVTLNASSADAGKMVANYFVDSLIGNEAQGDVEVTIANTITGFTFIGETLKFTDQSVDSARAENGLKMQSKTDVSVCDGVTLSTIRYSDYDDKPVVAYLLTCEPGSVDPVCALPHAADTIDTGKLQTVKDTAIANEQAFGYDICAAINGDLAYSAVLPCGTNYHNGVRLSHNSEFCFFAVMKDGSFKVAYDGDIKDKTQIKEAIGGRYLIMQNGQITDLGWGIDFAFVRHPRTALGFDDEGRLFLLVIDGRQPSYSNGASLPDMAIIFKGLGATNAINLDGGGSSSMVTKNHTTGEYTMWNKTSDGSPRAVINSLLFLHKSATE